MPAGLARLRNPRKVWEVIIEPLSSEAFVAHNPEVLEYLPVSEYRRKLGTRPPAEKFEQMTWMLLD